MNIVYEKQKELFKALSLDEKHSQLTDIIEAEIDFLNEDDDMEEFTDYWQNELDSLDSLSTHEAFENLAFFHSEILEALSNE